MRVARKTAVETLALLLLSCAVGLAGNAVRARGLELTRDYFQVRKTTLEAASSERSEEAASVEPGAADLIPNPGVIEVTLGDVMGYFHDPGYAPGASDTRYLFIDARNEAHYAEGHIPGALLVDHYYKSQYLPDVLPIVECAEKVIIYCNGGDCEDSVLVGVDLLEEGVPSAKICLFKGGWEAWEEAGLPVEPGEC